MVLLVHIDKKLGSPGDLGGMEPGADATVPAAKPLHSGPGEAVSKETVSMVPDAAAPADNGVAVATTEDEVQAGPSEPSAANTRTNLKYTTEDSMATIRSAANSPPARGLLAVATDDGLWVAEDVSDMVKADKGKGKAVEVVPTVEAGRTLVAAGDEQDEVEVDWTAYDAPEALLDLFGNESERVRTIIVRSVENVRTRIRAAREAQRTADGQDDEAKGKSLDHSANANGGESSVASASPSASPRASASTAGPSGAPAAVAAGPAKSSSPSLAGGEAEGAPVMPYMTSATPPSSPRPQKPSEKRSRFGFKNLFHRSHQRGESSSSGAASAIVRIAAEITTATRVDVGYYSGPSSHQASTPNVHKKRMSKGKGIALPKPLSRPASILSSKSMATSDTAPDAKPQVPPKDNEEECVSCLDEFPVSQLIKAPCSHGYCSPCFQRLVETSVEHEAQFPPRCCLTAIPLTTVHEHVPEGTDLRRRFDRRSVEWSIPPQDRVYCHVKTCLRFLPPETIDLARRIAVCPDSLPPGVVYVPEPPPPNPVLRAPPPAPPPPRLFGQVVARADDDEEAAAALLDPPPPPPILQLPPRPPSPWSPLHPPTCTLCRDKYHPVDTPCPQDRERQLADELAAESGWRRCPRCGVLVAHGGACAHMTCLCGETFCYVCGAHPWRSCGCTNENLVSYLDAAEMRRKSRERKEREEREEVERALRLVAEFEARERERAEREAEEARLKERRERAERERMRRRTIVQRWIDVRGAVTEVGALQGLEIARGWRDAARQRREAAERERREHLEPLRDAADAAAADLDAQVAAETARWKAQLAARVARERELEEVYELDLRAFYMVWPDADGGLVDMSPASRDPKDKGKGVARVTTVEDVALQQCPSSAANLAAREAQVQRSLRQLRRRHDGQYAEWCKARDEAIEAVRREARCSTSGEARQPAPDPSIPLASEILRLRAAYELAVRETAARASAEAAEEALRMRREAKSLRRWLSEVHEERVRLMNEGEAEELLGDGSAELAADIAALEEVEAEEREAAKREAEREAERMAERMAEKERFRTQARVVWKGAGQAANAKAAAKAAAEAKEEATTVEGHTIALSDLTDIDSDNSKSSGNFFYSFFGDADDEEIRSLWSHPRTLTTSPWSDEDENEDTDGTGNRDSKGSGDYTYTFDHKSRRWLGWEDENWDHAAGTSSSNSNGNGDDTYTFDHNDRRWLGWEDENWNGAGTSSSNSKDNGDYALSDNDHRWLGWDSPPTPTTTSGMGISSASSAFQRRRMGVRLRRQKGLLDLEDPTARMLKVCVNGVKS